MIQHKLVPGLVILLGFLAFAGCDTDSNDPGPGIEGPEARVVADSDFITTNSGLKYFDFVTGTGRVATVGDTLFVDYTGWLMDGTIFDSSVYVEGRFPIRIIIGTSSVISGWTEGLQGMQEGGQRQLVLPPSLAYGTTGSSSGTIPPNATLIFEVEVVNFVGN